MVRDFFTALAILSFATMSFGGPITLEEAKRQAQVLDNLKTALVKEKQAEAKYALVASAMKVESNVDVRYRMLDVAAGISGPGIESFLMAVIGSEEDSGVRSQMVALLGRHGSEKSLVLLLDHAEKDKTTPKVIGCISGLSNARRAAIFAVAELSIRHPKIAAEASAKLRALTLKEDRGVNDNLSDARIQALYQITHDESLLKPFYDLLKNKDAKERTIGVMNFRFLKLQKAPVEVIDALKDMSTDVRQSAALVLGEIADPKTADVLLAAACNTKEDVSVRVNAIDAVGRMKIPSTAEQIEKLLTDAEPNVPAIAAIALYRITGKKVKQFPEGYKAD